MRLLHWLAVLGIFSLAACSGGDSSPAPTVNAQTTPASSGSPLPPVGSPKPLQTIVPTPISTAPPSTAPAPSGVPTSNSSATPVPAPGEPSAVSPGPTYKPNMLLTGKTYETTGGTSGWLPTAIANALEYPIQYGFGGTGQTVAVIGTAMASQSDVNTYAAAAGLPKTPTVQDYTIGGGNPSPSSDDIVEATLDVETIAGLAPDAALVDIDVPSATNQNVMMGMSTALGLEATVISISYGGCEIDSLSDDDAYDQVAQQAASTGVTVVAAAGDTGPACASGSTFPTGVSEPASDPYVVAAGGSEDLLRPPYTSYSQIDSNLQNPQPWNDATTSGGGAGGGGISGHWSIPSYQNAPGIVSTAASASFRNVPDVAMPASNNAGPTAIYAQGNWVFVGGTSWSTPEFAAMQAEINQQCGSSRWGLPDLYRVFYQAPSSFVDVTSGNISWSTTSTTYAAGSGYDNASGLGIPLGEAIAVQDGC